MMGNLEEADIRGMIPRSIQVFINILTFPAYTQTRIIFEVSTAEGLNNS